MKSSLPSTWLSLRAGSWWVFQLSYLSIFSRLGLSACICLVNSYNAWLDPRVNCRDDTLAWVWHGHESFLRNSSSDVVMSPLSQPGRRQSFEVQFYGLSLILYSPATCGVSTSRPCVQSASHEPTKQSSAVVNMLGNIVFHRLWGLFNAYGRSFQYMIQKKNRTEKKKRWWFWFDDVSSIRWKRRVRLHTC